MLRRPGIAFALTLAGFIGAGAAPAAAYDPKPLPIGSPAPDFALPGVDGKTHALRDFASSRVLVVLFTCNHCPTAQAYEERVAKFHAEYKDRGVALVAISPNDAAAVRLDELGYTDLDDSFEAMKIRARDHKYTYPYLYDGETQAVSKAFGVLATPHVFVFGPDRKLAYAGRWDDAEVKRPVKSPDLLNAVNALLEGRAVPVATTRPFGCSTKWSDKRQSAVDSLAKWNAEPVSLEKIDDAGVAKLVKNDTPNLLVVNLWATWCGPCVEELPAFVEMHRMYRGRKFKMVTISMDEPDKADEALKVLKENHASTTNYLLRTTDRDRFAEALDKEWPGPLPYTMIIVPGGKVVYRKSGAIEPLDVKRAIVSVLGRTY
ncbi:MAG: redoxin domain-containing protein [Isosphaeraceae bacterium]